MTGNYTNNRSPYNQTFIRRISVLDVKKKRISVLKNVKISIKFWQPRKCVGYGTRIFDDVLICFQLHNIPFL